MSNGVNNNVVDAICIYCPRYSTGRGCCYHYTYNTVITNMFEQVTSEVTHFVQTYPCVAAVGGFAVGYSIMKHAMLQAPSAISSYINVLLVVVAILAVVYLTDNNTYGGVFNNMSANDSCCCSCSSQQTHAAVDPENDGLLSPPPSPRQ